MGNKRLGIEAVRTVKGWSTTKKRIRARSVFNLQESLGQTEALRLLTDAYTLNPNIFVRTLSDKRETP